ncbi:hypothetical protein [Bacillus andreraoultii]|uniref:hypothetical protein n=1 Tax=Bacillus andreraoultii TaxID=1499685 RepID=UPI00053A9055|nr:hypothetical protein [Bacillus andreraoultii]
MYNKYLVEIPHVNNCHFAASELELMNNTFEFEPIYKYATGKNYDCDYAEIYALNDEKLLTGYLVLESIKYCKDGIDGDVLGKNEIFLMPEGTFAKFHTLIEDNQYEDGKHNRVNRILAKDQILNINEMKSIYTRLSKELNL